MKVAIIGSGDVGRACAQRIAESNLADVILMDIVEGRAQACALDLSSAASLIRHCRSIKGTSEYKDIAGSDIVVLTAGQTRKQGQHREDLLSCNAAIAREASVQIAAYCPDAVVIVVSNPVDVMAYVAFKTTGFPLGRVIGMGGTSDCARFNMLAASELGTSSGDIQSVIIGPHSDNMVVLPRFSNCAGIPLLELLSEDNIEKIITQTRCFGANIVKLMGSGSASFGPSAGVFALVDAVVNDRKSFLCASCYLCGQYGIRDLYIGVPARIGRVGVEEIVELELTDKEKKAFLISTEGIKDLINQAGV